MQRLPREKNVNYWKHYCLLVLIGFCGCSAASREGSEAAARDYFYDEFHKWVSGQESDLETLESKLGTYKDPLSFDIRSVVPDTPDVLVIAENYSKNGATSADEKWAAWRFNAVIEWKSVAGAPD